jgi:hypothetical protein
MQIQSCHAQAFSVRIIRFKKKKTKTWREMQSCELDYKLRIKTFNFLQTVSNIQEQCGNETRIFSRITHQKGSKSYVLQLMWNWKLCFSMN